MFGTLLHELRDDAREMLTEARTPTFWQGACAMAFVALTLFALWVMFTVPAPRVT